MNEPERGFKSGLECIALQLDCPGVIRLISENTDQWLSKISDLFPSAKILTLSPPDKQIQKKLKARDTLIIFDIKPELWHSISGLSRLLKDARSVLVRCSVSKARSSNWPSILQVGSYFASQNLHIYDLCEVGVIKSTDFLRCTDVIFLPQASQYSPLRRVPINNLYSRRFWTKNITKVPLKILFQLLCFRR